MSEKMLVTAASHSVPVSNAIVEAFLCLSEI